MASPHVAARDRQRLLGRLDELADIDGPGHRRRYARTVCRIPSAVRPGPGPGPGTDRMMSWYGYVSSSIRSVGARNLAQMRRPGYRLRSLPGSSFVLLHGLTTCLPISDVTEFGIAVLIVTVLLTFFTLLTVRTSCNWIGCE